MYIYIQYIGLKRFGSFFFLRLFFLFFYVSPLSLSKRFPLHHETMTDGQRTRSPFYLLPPILVTKACRVDDGGGALWRHGWIYTDRTQKENSSTRWGLINDHSENHFSSPSHFSVIAGPPGSCCVPRRRHRRSPHPLRPLRRACLPAYYTMGFFFFQTCHDGNTPMIKKSKEDKKKKTTCLLSQFDPCVRPLRTIWLLETTRICLISQSRAKISYTQ